MLSVHAPTEVSEDDVKDGWHDLLENTTNNIPGHDTLIILGDLNAPVGREANTFGGVVGSHSLHVNSNDNGLCLLTLAVRFGLVIGGTLFPHRNVHKSTWSSPDGSTSKQIDHVLVHRTFRSSLTDVRACRGADCRTQLPLLTFHKQLMIISKMAVHVRSPLGGFP